MERTSGGEQGASWRLRVWCVDAAGTEQRTTTLEGEVDDGLFDRWAEGDMELAAGVFLFCWQRECCASFGAGDAASVGGVFESPRSHAQICARAVVVVAGLCRDFELERLGERDGVAVEDEFSGALLLDPDGFFGGERLDRAGNFQCDGGVALEVGKVVDGSEQLHGVAFLEDIGRPQFDEEILARDDLGAGLADESVLRAAFGGEIPLAGRLGELDLGLRFAIFAGSDRSEPDGGGASDASVAGITIIAPESARQHGALRCPEAQPGIAEGRLCGWLAELATHD